MGQCQSAQQTTVRGKSRSRSFPGPTNPRIDAAAKDKPTPQIKSSESQQSMSEEEYDGSDSHSSAESGPCKKNSSVFAQSIVAQSIVRSAIRESAAPSGPGSPIPGMAARKLLIAHPKHHSFVSFDESLRVATATSATATVPAPTAAANINITSVAKSNTPPVLSSGNNLSVPAKPISAATSTVAASRSASSDSSVPIVRADSVREIMADTKTSSPPSAILSVTKPITNTIASPSQIISLGAKPQRVMETRRGGINYDIAFNDCESDDLFDASCVSVGSRAATMLRLSSLVCKLDDTVSRTKSDCPVSIVALSPLRPPSRSARSDASSSYNCPLSARSDFSDGGEVDRRPVWLGKKCLAIPESHLAIPPPVLVSGRSDTSDVSSHTSSLPSDHPQPPAPSPTAQTPTAQTQQHHLPALASNRSDSSDSNTFLQSHHQPLPLASGRSDVSDASSLPFHPFHPYTPAPSDFADDSSLPEIDSE